MPPAFSMLIFGSSLSTQMTVFPFSARQAPTTRPTYPVPTTAIFIYSPARTWPDPERHAFSLAHWRSQEREALTLACDHDRTVQTHRRHQNGCRVTQQDTDAERLTQALADGCLLPWCRCLVLCPLRCASCGAESKYLVTQGRYSGTRAQHQAAQAVCGKFLGCGS